VKATNFALVTPSYAPDFERCQLLCESVERFVSVPVTHYIVLTDTRDYAQFAPLQNAHTRIVHRQEILPAWIKQLPLKRGYWISTRTRPIRGWIMQQLAKIALAAQLQEEAAIFVDSDTVFVRPTDLSSLYRGENLRLYAEPGGNPQSMPEHSRWHRVASRVLGLEDTPFPAPDYIQNLTSWRPANARAMCKHIEQRNSRSWVECLAGCSQFSEYILYGSYIERVAQGTAGHFLDAQKICLDYWTPEPLSDAQLKAFMVTLQPQHLAVMFSAKARMSPQRYRQLLDDLA